MTKNCEKCGYESDKNRQISNGKYLCSICSKFAPAEDKLQEYVQEKADWKYLETFRKFYSKGKLKTEMDKRASQGNVLARPALGYKMENKELLPDPEKSLVVQEIYQTFLNQSISLTQLAKKFNLSVNGLKKVLRNFTYIGKTKFSGRIMQGNHQPIISPELFNKVQNKLENLGVS